MTGIFQWNPKFHNIHLLTTGNRQRVPATRQPATTTVCYGLFGVAFEFYASFAASLWWVLGFIGLA